MLPARSHSSSIVTRSAYAAMSKALTASAGSGRTSSRSTPPEPRVVTRSPSATSRSVEPESLLRDRDAGWLRMARLPVASGTGSPWWPRCPEPGRPEPPQGRPARDAAVPRQGRCRLGDALLGTSASDLRTGHTGRGWSTSPARAARLLGVGPSATRRVTAYRPHHVAQLAGTSEGHRTPDHVTARRFVQPLDPQAPRSTG